MEHRRLRRTVLSSVFAAVIALGGYYVGYAKTHEQPTEPDLDNPSFLGKLPPDFCYVMVHKFADKLGIKPDLMKKVEANTRPHLQEYFKAQRELWRLELEQAKLAEEGRVLVAGQGFGPEGYAEIMTRLNRDKPMSRAWAKIAVSIAETIGRDRNDKLNKLTAEFRKTPSAAEFDLLFDPANADILHLTEVQKNQMILLQAYFAHTVRNKGKMPSKTFRLDEVWPHREENARTLKGAIPAMKSNFYWSTLERLSPVQKLRMQALARSKTYVQP